MILMRQDIAVNVTQRRDPTRTLLLRNRFVAQTSRRFRHLKALITQSVALNNALGLDPPFDLDVNQPLPTRAFQFRQDPQKIAAFMDWMQLQVNLGIFEIGTGLPRTTLGNVPWAGTFIDAAYKRGIGRGNAELARAGVAAEQLPLGPFASIDSAFNLPIHADSVAIIQTRVFTDLVDITEAMETQIADELARGIAEGRNPREIARRLTNRIEKSGGTLAIVDKRGRGIRAINRAKTLARTEIIRAHHIAMINTYREAGVEGVVVRAEWATAGDSRVCPDCAFMEGRVFTLDEVEGLIPLHASCRCIGLPLIGVEEGRSLTSRDRARTVGSRSVTKKGQAKRAGFFEDITGERLPNAPAPGRRFTVPGGGA